MRVEKLSTILYENPFNLEGFRNVVTIYNLQCGNEKTNEEHLNIEDLDRVFEDFDLLCDVHELRAVSNSSAFHLGLVRDIPLPPIQSIRRKGSTRKLPLPFTVEELIDYLKENKIDFNFEPSLVSNNFKRYWLI